MGTRNVPKKEFIEALEASGGNQSRAADMLGLKRAAVCMRLKRNPELRETLDQAVERRVDTVEDKLYDLCLEGDVRAITLFMKGRGKPRGYVDRQEVTGANGGPVPVARYPTEEILKTDEFREYERRILERVAAESGPVRS